MRECLPQILAYLTDLAISRKRSPCTIYGYAGDINYFLGYLWRVRKLNIGLGSVDEQLGAEYSLWLVEKIGLKPSTHCRRIICLRQLFKWLTRNRHIPRNPLWDLEVPEVPEGFPKPFKPKELERLFMRPGANTFLGVRTLLSMEIMYGSGTRLSELLDLRFKDINLDGFNGEPVITVFGKGRKVRLVPMTLQAVKTYSRYLSVRGDGGPNDFIFLSRRGARLSTDAQKRAMRELGKETGVANVTCHRFRHSFATDLLASGVPLEVLADLMGHSSIAITRVYARVAPVQAFRAYAGASIREKLNVQRNFEFPVMRNPYGAKKGRRP